nr:Hsp70 family protein [Microbacterium sp. MAH-37]
MLALDAGTSRWEAAVSYHSASSGEIEVESAEIDGGPGSTAVLGFVTDDGDVVFGHEAEKRGVRAPDRLIRGFTREVGDDAPVVVGGFAATPAEFVARLARWIVDDVSAQHDAAPAAVVLVHPAEWSGHRLAAVHAALRAVGLGDVAMMRAPIAAVHGHPPQASEEARTVVVYDLGGDGFRATVVQQDAERLRCVGESVALPDVGGDDLDDALLVHVLRMAGADLAAAVAPDRRAALADLRSAVTSAKESLSSDADAAVPVRLPSLETSVRITRSEFESMAGPMLERTLDATEAAIDAAGLSTRAIDAIVLAGGSSRIPLVAQRLSERFDRPLLADDDPGATIARGAARAAGAYLLPSAATAAVTETPITETPIAEDPGDDDEDAAAPTRRPRPGLVPAFSLGTAAVLVAGGLILAATTPAGERAGADEATGAGSTHSTVMPPRNAAFIGVLSAEPDASDGPDTAQAAERLDGREPGPVQETGAPERSGGSASAEDSSGGGSPGTGTSAPAPAPQPSQPASDPAPVDAAPPAAEPAPEPTTDPVPAPEPTTDPAPVPDPEPTGDPAPSGDPAPPPQPASDPAPAPEPTSDPAPAPEQSVAPAATEAPAP